MLRNHPLAAVNLDITMVEVIDAIHEIRKASVASGIDVSDNIPNTSVVHGTLVT